MVNFKEASYYKKLPNKKVKCRLCPHQCIINNGEVGICKVRMNIHGNLKAMNYGKPHTVKYETIEEFPFYHFAPKSQVLSIGAIGDNLENPWENEYFHGKSFDEIPTLNQDPMKIIKQAEENKIKIIAYKYSEPGMFFEFMKDISNNSRRNKHIMITNGFLEKEPAKDLTKRINAVLFEIKSMNESFHENVLKGKLDSILDTMKIFHNENVWIEIKMDLIPEIHNDLYDVRKLVSWILNNLDANVPLHFMTYNKEEDKIDYEFLEKVRKIAKNAGLNYVYVHGGNNIDGEITFCPNCTKPLVYRNTEKGFNFINNGKCACGKEIAGIWE